VLTLEDQPFTTGRCRYTDADGRSHGAAKICIKVVPGNWESPVLAVLDSAADWSVINSEIAEDLGLFGIEGESIALSTRFGTIAGRLVHAPMTLVADDGDSLRIDATVFISADWPRKAGTFLGYSGLLERIRFAVDPQRNDFFFGPIG
jgi:hypothetical protein